MKIETYAHIQTTSASQTQTHSSAIPKPKKEFRMKHHCYGCEISIRRTRKGGNSPLQVLQKPVVGCDVIQISLLSLSTQLTTGI